MAEPRPALALKGVTKRFGALVASDDVSLELRPGEIHALIGPNGAGKSTVIKQIAGELPCDSGEIWFDGRLINGLSAPERARAGLARSFQMSTLALELSALQNVALAAIGRDGGAFGMLGAVRSDRALLAEAMAHLDRVGLADQAAAPVAVLAHGQRRRLEMAIALCLKPKVFLLDEPMAGLGDSGGRELTRLLDGLRHEAPILLVEHDMDAVFALADRISVLFYGRVIATGAVAEIRANPDVQEAYLGEGEA